MSPVAKHTVFVCFIRNSIQSIDNCWLYHIFFLICLKTTDDLTVFANQKFGKIPANAHVHRRIIHIRMFKIIIKGDFVFSIHVNLVESRKLCVIIQRAELLNLFIRLWSLLCKLVAWKNPESQIPYLCRRNKAAATLHTEGYDHIVWLCSQSKALCLCIVIKRLLFLDYQSL